MKVCKWRSLQLIKMKMGNAAGGQNGTAQLGCWCT